jgi:hypothetical protein
VAVGRDADPLSSSEERADHPRTAVGLARPGRALDREDGSSRSRTIRLPASTSGYSHRRPAPNAACCAGGIALARSGRDFVHRAPSTRSAIAKIAFSILGIHPLVREERRGCSSARLGPFGSEVRLRHRAPPAPQTSLAPAAIANGLHILLWTRYRSTTRSASRARSCPARSTNSRPPGLAHHNLLRAVRAAGYSPLGHIAAM